ncbi:MAG: BMP family protein [Lachnospiraceae bacterium]|nr:BMP family protein [Lachnospiraceae bacterium]
MRKRSKLVSLLVTGMLTVALLCGCGNSSTKDESAQKASEESLKVALVLSGSADDQSFNQNAYEGLMKIEKELGCEVAYSENTATADEEKTLRAYGDAGYDVIIGHGGEYSDIIQKVAPDYPDSLFIIHTGTVYGDNYASLKASTYENAYLAGVLSAFMTKSNKIGCVAGFDFPDIVKEMNSFSLGAQSVNPNLSADPIYLGSFDDVSLGSEAAAALINSGVDFIYENADAAGVGIINGCKDSGTYAVANGAGKVDLAPESVIAYTKVDYGRMDYLAIQAIKEGTFKCDVHVYGLETEVIDLCMVGEGISEEAKEAVAKAKEDIIAGKITFEE